MDWNIFKKRKEDETPERPAAPAKNVRKTEVMSPPPARPSPPPAAAQPAPAPDDEVRFRYGQILHVPGLGEFTVHDTKGGKGKSGMGVVYIVLDVVSLTPYAVKTFQRWCLKTPELVGRFLLEAETWIRLEQHPNIVRAFYVATIQDQPYIFLEYVAGADLRKKMAAGPLPAEDALRYSIMFCRGMAHAQRKVPGLVHRDVKPENCMFTPNGILKVTDFGLVKVLAQSDSSTKDETGPDGEPLQSRFFKTRAGQTGAGTLPYMAPEQFVDFGQVTVLADIYSFGIMLYEMLTGHRPFRARTPDDYYFQHLKNIPQSPALIRPEVGWALSDLTTRCMAKRPEDRFENFEALERQLAEILKNEFKTEVPQAEAGELEAWEIVNKGAALSNLGRAREALSYFDMAVKMFPRFDAAWLNKGVALDKSGQKQEALVCYQKALELNPRSGEAWYNLGIAYQGQGMFEKALDAYDHALALDTQSEAAWLNKGVVLRQLHRPQDAIQCYDCVLAINPQSAVAWHNKGFALSQLGNTEQELICYDKALTINPDFVEAWLNRGVALRKANRLIEALLCYEKALDLNPRNADAWYNRGQVHRRLGQKREAQNAFQMAAGLDPAMAEQLKQKGLLAT